MNDSENSTIHRCLHDKENPYAQISKELIRDNSISPNCRLIIIGLLSNKDGWSIKPTQLINQYKGYLGKDKIYNLINEAIEAGYIKRYKVSRGGNLFTYDYVVSESPKFKGSFQNPEFQDPGFQDPENKDNNKEHYLTKKKVIINKDNVRTSPPSAMDEKKPLQKDRFVNKLNPDQRKLHDQITRYKPQCGEAPDSDSVCAWFLDKKTHKHTNEQIANAFIVFRQDESDMAQKGQNIDCMAAYLLGAIKSSRKPRNAAYDANKQMATLACKEFTDIRILDKYVSYMFGNDEITINYDLPMSTFIDCLGKAKQKIQMQKEYV